VDSHAAFEDASLVGMGAVLVQCHEQGQYRPVLLLSRKWCAAERNYGATERGGFAVVTVFLTLKWSFIPYSSTSPLHLLRDARFDRAKDHSVNIFQEK
jgi:hypothetical protein